MKDLTPFSAVSYWILLALAAGNRSHTEIQDQITADSVGLYVSDGTLHAALRRLAHGGLIEGQAGRGGRYHLTATGRRKLDQESRRLA